MNEARVGPARDEDLDALADVLSRVRPLDPPYTALALHDAARAPAALLLSAVVEGRVVGGAIATSGGAWRQPDRAVMVPALTVDEAWRGRGIGARLADQVEVQAFAAGAARVVTSIRADAEPAMRFATARGFREFHREAWSLLELQGWDAARFADVAEVANDRHVRVLTLGEALALPDDERRAIVAEIDRAERELLADMPPSEITFPAPDLERYERAKLRSLHPEASLVALRGDRVAALVLARSRADFALILAAGEVGPGRGRKLIVPLKLRSIDALKRSGAQRVAAMYDRDNAVTRQLNRSLGFERQPPHIRLELRRGSVPSRT